MIRSIGTIPEWKLCGNEIDGRTDERTSMGDRRESVDGAEVARDVNWDKEEICFRWICGVNGTVENSVVDGNFRGEEMIGAAWVGEPVGIVLRW